MQTTPARRTALPDFLSDLLDFIDEKMAEAVADPRSQLAAIEEAACAMPMIRDRLGEDEVMWTKFVLVLGIKIERAYWRDWWDNFAELEHEDFLREAGQLTGPGGTLDVLRSLLRP
jgi:hypothetical protein